MAENCILWLDADTSGTELGAKPGTEQASAKCRWLVLDAQGNRVGHPQEGNLAEAARICAGRKTILLLPGERIHDLNASIPGKNPQKLLQAAPYALEDRFAEDIEDLHFALLERHGSNHQRFLVADRGWLADLLARLASHDIRPVSALPDYLGVDLDAEREHWVMTDSRLLARARDGLGFAADMRYAEGLWPGTEDEPAPRITLLDDVELPGNIRSEASAIEELGADTLFTRMGRVASALANPGLLQGDFRTRKESNEKIRRWRPAAGLAAAFLLVLLLGWGVDIWRLNTELDALEKQAEQQFKRILPNARMGGDPRGQIESAIMGERSESNLALDMIAALGTGLSEIGLSETGEASLQAFSFRGNRLEFSVMVKNAEKLEALRRALEQQGPLRVNISSANAQGDALEGRLTMEAAAR